MKQTLKTNHLLGILEQVNQELQMAIDYIKTLMVKADLRSSSNIGQTKSKSEREQFVDDTSTDNTQNTNSNLRGNFVDESSKNQSKESNTISAKYSDEFYDEPNYYYGGNLFSKVYFISRPVISHKNSNIKTNKLVFNSLEKNDLLKNKFCSQTKVEGTSKNIDRITTLLDINSETQTPYIKTLDIPMLDKKRKKIDMFLKRANVLRTNTVSVIQTSTQTSFPGAAQAEFILKPTFNSTIESRCNNSLDRNYTSAQTQTQPIYVDFSSQTTKSLYSTAICSSNINKNVKQSYIKSSLQTYTGTSNAKINGNVCLYHVVDDFPIKECKHNGNQLRRVTSPKKIKFLRERELCKQNKLHKKLVTDKQYIHSQSLSLDTIIQRNTAIYEKNRNNQKEYTKTPYKYVEKLLINRKSYDCDSSTDNSKGSLCPVENFPKSVNFKNKCKCKKSNERVNVEGVSIDAWTKLSLLNILNSL